MRIDRSPLLFGSKSALAGEGDRGHGNVQLDDVVIVALVLRSLLRSGGESLVREHWPRPENALALVLRLAA